MCVPLLCVVGVVIQSVIMTHHPTSPAALRPNRPASSLVTNRVPPHFWGSIFLPPFTPHSNQPHAHAAPSPATRASAHRAS